MAEVNALTGAARVAERCARFKTPHNTRFFEALCTHLGPLHDEPALTMWFEFAITTNQRGRDLVALLAKYADPRGKRYLDIGCAYGGFLVAFAEAGAEVHGIDINQGLLALGRHNLEDSGHDFRMLQRDATKAAELAEFRNAIDIATCNDVIEHVPEPSQLLRNIASLLKPDGLAYFEIPNGKCPAFVMRDGHYQLFGITLLEFEDARGYHSAKFPGHAYDTFNYLSLDEYSRLFIEAGLELRLMEETLTCLNLEHVTPQIEELRRTWRSQIDSVPDAFREDLTNRLNRYFEEIDNSPRATVIDQRQFLIDYGAGFWRLIARRL